MRPQIPRAVTETRVVAIVRGREAQHLEAVVEALVGAGIRCIELTMNTPSAMEVLGRLRRLHPSVAWGAGTVLSVADAHHAADAGAEFAVAPNLDEHVGEACASRGMAWFPGAATATEIARAWRRGACAVKVFPAASVGGPSFLREIGGPLDQVRLLPTGGVALDDIPAYLDAGAVAVGLGGALMGDALVTGDVEALADRAARALALASGEERQPAVEVPARG